MALSYYIYYRVARPDLAGAAVRALQSSLLEKQGVRGRLLRKRDEPLLWMEVYEGVHDSVAFEAELARLVEAMKFGNSLTAGSTRRTECFEERCA